MASSFRSSWVDDAQEAACGKWPDILGRLGVDVASMNSHRHYPCPGCGGSDRFRFDDKDGKGTFLCSQGGGEPLAGDGFKLLEHVYGWAFIEAARNVAEVLGIETGKRGERRPANEATAKQKEAQRLEQVARDQAKAEQERLSRERSRASMERIMQEWVPVAECPPVLEYWRGRGIPDRYILGAQNLMAHPALPYYFVPKANRKEVESKSQHLGDFPAWIGICRSPGGQIVNLHRTWLKTDGSGKISIVDHTDPKRGLLPARKLMTPLLDVPYAIGLYPAQSGILGIAEGTESAISAAILNDVPCQSVIDSGKMIHYMPPAGLRNLLIFADPDPAGVHAAETLRDRLAQERTELIVEIRYPPRLDGNPRADWNDVLQNRQSAKPASAVDRRRAAVAP